MIWYLYGGKQILRTRLVHGKRRGKYGQQENEGTPLVWLEFSKETERLESGIPMGINFSYFAGKKNPCPQAENSDPFFTKRALKTMNRIE